MAFAPLPLTPAYAISKAAAFNLTQSLRALLAGRGVRVHAVLTGPTDTDMTRGFDIPKASPESVARAIFDGVENGEEEIFPDPMSQSLAESWRSGAAKALERQNAALVLAPQSPPRKGTGVGPPDRVAGSADRELASVRPSSRDDKKERTMTDHKTGTREEWLAARLELLDAEKELTRRSDELARQRQELPWVRIDKEYQFDTDEGPASLADLFRGRSQLLVYHFMFGPDVHGRMSGLLGDRRRLQRRPSSTSPTTT